MRSTGLDSSTSQRRTSNISLSYTIWSYLFPFPRPFRTQDSETTIILSRPSSPVQATTSHDNESTHERQPIRGARILQQARTHVESGYVTQIPTHARDRRLDDHRGISQDLAHDKTHGPGESHQCRKRAESIIHHQPRPQAVASLQPDLGHVLISLQLLVPRRLG